MATSFGEFIRQNRANNQMTLTQLAALLGIDSANLSKIETGKRNFDEKKLERLAIVFNVDLEELRIEYFSDLIAKKIYIISNTKRTLNRAEEKVKQLKTTLSKTTKLHY